MGYFSRNEWGPASTSSLTVGPWLIAGASRLALSTVSFAGAGSTVVQFSNADGLTAAIPANSWSTTTSIAAQGSYLIEPGMRWVRFLRSDSSVTITLEQFY